MKLLGRPHGKSLPLMLAAAVMISTTPLVTGCSRGDEPQSAPSVAAAQEQPTVVPTPTPPPPNEEPGPAPGAASDEELQELVSPIALYPDVLVAQILAGSTYPTQVVEADRWLKQNSNLTGDALASQVNQQPWDPSIKSLTQFPSVLDTMNNSLGWTSALGEAYYNQPGDVMNAIQVMRNKAVAAGTLKSTSQQTVETQPAPPAPPAEQGGTQPPSVQQTVIIQPAQPNTVYVPQYNPTSAYGAPVAAPAGYSGSDLLLTGVLSFGAGILLGSLINNGDNHWGCNWYGGGHGNYYSSSVKYNNNVYITNNNNYPGRYPNGGNGYPGYGKPGYGNGRPGNGYPGNGNGRPNYPGNGGQRPPYNGGGAGNRPGNRPGYPNGGGPNRPNNPNIPTTRPYKPGSPSTKPNFPKPSTLPNNPESGNQNRPGKGNQKTKEGAQNRPGHGGNGNPGPSTRPAAPNRPATPNKPANRDADPARGFNKGGNATGGRNSAFGGGESGSVAQSNRARGQASFNGNKGGGGGGGGGNRGGGGGGNRGGGGGGNRGGGGGGGKGGGRKNR